VSGTPTFFINGTGIVGAQGWEVFETAIETALKSP
jgi:protein-disulfide isomerase